VSREAPKRIMTVHDRTPTVLYAQVHAVQYPRSQVSVLNFPLRSPRHIGAWLVGPRLATRPLLGARLTTSIFYTFRDGVLLSANVKDFTPHESLESNPTAPGPPPSKVHLMTTTVTWD